MTYPTAPAIRAARTAAGLTQPAAARLIGRTTRQWMRYEAGTSRLDPILWRVWQVQVARIVKRAMAQHVKIVNLKWTEQP